MGGPQQLHGIKTLAIRGGLGCVILAALLATGCQAWRNRGDNAAPPNQTDAAQSSAESAKDKDKRRWLGDLLPPRGEYFFDERSHEIERSLQRRGPNVSF